MKQPGKNTELSTRVMAMIGPVSSFMAWMVAVRASRPVAIRRSMFSSTMMASSTTMSSQSTNDGNYTLTVTFEIGTDVNIAQVLVQNRVALAQPQLPSQVQLEGVNTKKSSPTILLAINLHVGPQKDFDPFGAEDAA